jgi:AAA15 family ATPase/GTPase
VLNSIHLEHFKKFKDAEVQLRPFTVLMGENGSGKTTVLQAINFALHSLYFRKLLYSDKGAIRVREKGVVLTLNDLPGMNVSEPMEMFYDKKKYKKEKGIGDATLTLRDSLNNTYRLQITSNYRNFIVRCSSSPEDLEKISVLSSLQPLLISGFVGLRSTEERAFPRAIQDKLQTGRMSDIIRNLVLDMKEQKPQAYNLLNEQLVREFSFHLDSISFNPEQDINVNAYFKDTHEGRDITLDFNSAGSGFMQVLQILVPIYRFASTDATVFLLDEPDAHLHPNLQYTLAQVLRKASRTPLSGDQT